jgi:hypothetical protein
MNPPPHKKRKSQHSFSYFLSCYYCFVMMEERPMVDKQGARHRSARARAPQRAVFREVEKQNIGGIQLIESTISVEFLLSILFVYFVAQGVWCPPLTVPTLNYKSHER